MHQILYPVDNEISFPNTYPLDSNFHLSVGFKNCAGEEQVTSWT